MTRKASDENFFVEKYAIAQDATPFESRRTDARRETRRYFEDALPALIKCYKK